MEYLGGMPVSSGLSKDEAKTTDKDWVTLLRGWRRKLPTSPKPYMIGALVLLMVSFLVIAGSLPNAYAVLVNGEQVALVGDRAQADTILQQVAAEISSEQEVYVDAVITFERARAKDKDLATDRELAEIFKKKLNFLCDAYAVCIDGQAKIYVSSEESAQQVLASFKDSFVPREGELLSVEFAQDVEVKASKADPGKLSSVDEAVALLKNGGHSEQRHVVKQGESLWTIARANDLGVEDLIAANPGLTEDSVLGIGDEVKLSKVEPLAHVVVEYEKEVLESIPYETEYTQSGEIWRGYTRVVQKGHKGKKEVLYHVVSKNGVKVQQEELHSKVLEEPTKMVVARGTRVMVASRGDGGSGSLGWPSRGTITSRYGYRGREFHGAIDIDGNTGDPVYAADSGTVMSTGWSGGYGNEILIDHSSGLVTRYAHLSKILVGTGEKVSRGQLIGRVGSSGRSTGSHLHFEVMVNGRKVTPFNYLN